MPLKSAGLYFNIRFKENLMSRVINPNTPGKERNRLKKGIALALRELLKTSEPNSKTRDLVAFILLALEGIVQTVEVTTTAWEKRDYWLKADRFRLEWEWASKLGKELRPLVLEQDWDGIAAFSADLYRYVGDIKISPRHRMGQPWLGAWEELINRL
jgi:hypothetical protein